MERIRGEYSAVRARALSVPARAPDRMLKKAQDVTYAARPRRSSAGFARAIDPGEASEGAAKAPSEDQKGGLPPSEDSR